MKHLDLNNHKAKHFCSLDLRKITSKLDSENKATDLKVPKKNSKNGQRCFSFMGAKTFMGA